MAGKWLQEPTANGQLLAPGKCSANPLPITRMNANAKHRARNEIYGNSRAPVSRWAFSLSGINGLVPGLHLNVKGFHRRAIPGPGEREIEPAGAQHAVINMFFLSPVTRLNHCTDAQTIIPNLGW